MIRSLALALAAAALVAATPALADWEKTRWGDPVDKVIAAAGDGAEPIAGAKDQRVFEQDWRARRLGTLNGVAVEWQFFFDPAGGLSVVKIVPQDYANCPAFLPMIRAPLGDPQDGTVQKIGPMDLKSSVWADREGNLAMMVVDVFNPGNDMRLCHITYQPYGQGKPGLRSKTGKRD